MFFQGITFISKHPTRVVTVKKRELCQSPSKLPKDNVSLSGTTCLVRTSVVPHSTSRVVPMLKHPSGRDLQTKETDGGAQWSPSKGRHNSRYNSNPLLYNL